MIARRHSPIRALALFGFLLIGAVIIGATLAALKFRDHALANTERELKNTSLILAEQTDRAIQSLDLVLSGIIDRAKSLEIHSTEDFERQMSGQDVQLTLKDKISGFPQIEAVSLINQDGIIINMSGFWPSPRISIADRKYFQAMTSNPQLNFLISGPVRNRATGTWTVFVIRRLIDSNGKLIGLVHGSIDLKYFEDLFGSIVLGDQSSITLQRSEDGTLLARHPRAESAIGTLLPGALKALEQSNSGAVRLIGKIDGKERLVAANRLAHYPLLIAVATEVDAALAGWRSQTRSLVGGAGLTVILLTVIFILIVRRLSRQHEWAKERLALEKSRLNTAVNNMSQGLLLFDSSERIVVCNERYIQMYGLSPDVVKPGCTFVDLIRHREEVGSFKGNVEEYRLSLVGNLAQGKVTELTIETPDRRSIRIVNQPIANGGWVATHEDVTDRKHSDERIAHLAHYDSLTDLPNRMLFREQLVQSLKRVGRGERLALLYLDLDQFKTINDTLGHPVGDELLKIVGSRLRASVRETDIVARLGGDEFAIIQAAILGPTDVIDLVTRIHEAVRQPCETEGHLLVADASIGIALAPNDGTDPDQLLRNADLAMYGAKAEGRGKFHFFEPAMDACLKARRAMEFDLREAIMCEGFEIFYQPLVNLQDNTIAGCEALLRWPHRQRGMISPIEFIPIAEETGLIVRLGEWVLRTACAEAILWPDDIKVAVNVSPVQFKNGNLVQIVISALAASRLPAHRLELEITEAVLIRDDEAALTTLHQLRSLGVRIAMDDFGTGYSSLGYLQRFPFDKIKIDRTFIEDITEADGSRSIVQAVLSIARSRNMTTTAEGVETVEQRKLLHELGCAQIQGFLFSPAIPAAEILQLLLSYRERTRGAA